MNDVYLTDRQVADRYSVSRATVWRWAAESNFPKKIKLGENCSRWRLAELQEWEKGKEAA